MRKHLLLGISTFTLGFGSALYLTRPADAGENPAFPLLRLFGDAFATVEKQYVTPVDDRRLIEGAIAGMMRSLDDHSDYLGPETYSLLSRPRGNPIGGAGLVLASDERGLKIVGLTEDAPGKRSGLQAGDAIVAIDGRSTLRLSLDNGVALLRGEVGSPVTLTIARSGSPDFDVRLIREVVKSHVANARMEGDFGYLRPSQFDNGAAASAATALRDLEAHNPAMKGLVLDLRNNPGGLLSEAVGVAGLYLNGGTVVSERGRDPNDVERFNAPPHGDRLGGRPLVVLINAGTGSGAEIVAGALQDRGRALLVGMTSFGVGTIQTVIPLHGGVDGALKLTTARYYTPNGRAIQGVGIQPDVKVAATIAEAAEPRRRVSEASLANTLSPESDKAPALNLGPAEAPPSATFAGDFQLKRALDVLRSRPAPKPR